MSDLHEWMNKTIEVRENRARKPWLFRPYPYHTFYKKRNWQAFLKHNAFKNK